MIEAGILEQCDSPTLWNTKAFPVQKNSDPTKCRIVGDFRGLNNVLLKLYWHTESSNQLLRHIDPNARYFCVIDAKSGFHQVPVDSETSKLLTIAEGSLTVSYRKEFATAVHYGTSSQMGTPDLILTWPS